MGIQTIKSAKVVTSGLALLEREVVLPGLVWRDAVSDFRGALGDTVSLRLPAFAVAERNTLRSGAARQRGNLHQRKVDVALDTRVYFDTELTDEELSLDIVNFTSEVMAPIVGGIAREAEVVLAETIEGATYATELALDESNPYNTLVDARAALNKASVPMSGRVYVAGADQESAILKAAELVSNLAESGDASAIRDAQTGRIAGFNVIVSNAITPGAGYAFHRTAFALAGRAPIVPQGAPWGQSVSRNGFAMRAVQIMDPSTITDVLAVETWLGANVVTDFGSLDENGVFTPGVDPDDPEVGESDLLVRAVKVATTES